MSQEEIANILFSEQVPPVSKSIKVNGMIHSEDGVLDENQLNFFLEIFTYGMYIKFEKRNVTSLTLQEFEIMNKYMISMGVDIKVYVNDTDCTPWDNNISEIIHLRIKGIWI
jgi:hypothetical protein